MARRATIQLKVHRQVVQRIDRLIDLLEQIRGGGQRASKGPGVN